MNKSIIAIIIVVALIALGGIFYITKNGPKSAETNTEKTQNESINAPTTETKKEPNAQKESEEKEKHIITYTDSGFSPETIKIKAGETVIFKNQNSKLVWPASAMHPTHIVYSETALNEHCPDTTNIAFDACKGMPQGEEWSFKFDKIGSWKYHDHLNAAYRGIIIVE